VDARRKTAIRLSEDARDGFARVAAKGSFDKTQGKAPPFGAEDGEPAFQPKGGFAPSKRQIPEDHQFDKKAIKPIVKSLWAMSVALGHALTAHRQFSRLKSSTFSPDGLLGGRGYVMPVKEIRQQLFEACENLSALVDTLHDEINAPHWKPKLADLEKTDMAEVERLLSDAEEWVDNPEEESDEEMQAVEEHAAWTKERFKKDHKSPRSDIPGGGDKETVQKSGPSPGSPDHPQNKQMKEASAGYDRRTSEERQREAFFEEQPGVLPQDFLYREVPLTALAMEKVSPDLRALYARFYQANSSVDPGTLPGPRVDHLDRADVDQTGPGGSYNREDPATKDQWGETDGVSGEPMSDNTGDSYAYPSDWSGDESAKWAASSKEQNAGEYDNMPSRTIYNPHAVMPGDSEAPLGDRAKGDHYQTIEDRPEEHREASYDRRSYSGWTNPTHNQTAPWTNSWQPLSSSSVPDSATDSTPGEGFDFGIGDGNGNDAHGQAAGGYGESNPSAPDSNPGSGAGNRGVFGPQAELPNDPGGSTHDREHSDTTPSIEQGIGNNSVPARSAAGALPNDDQGPVPRSDYYWGDKGNDFNYDKNHNAAPSAQSKTPGNDVPQPPAPMKARPMHLYEHEFSAQGPSTPDPMASSGMPGDESDVYDSAPGYSPDEWHRTEHGDQPYIKYDDDTHNMRPDWNTQRGDLPAPYVNQTTP